MTEDSLRRLRPLVAEALGTLLLVATVVGSGIMAQRLFHGTDSSDGLVLLANTAATAAGLLALILCFAPISGSHFNPAVSLAAFWEGRLSRREASAFGLAQMVGALGGTLFAHLMFSAPLLQISHHARPEWPMLLSEFTATFALVVVIRGTRNQALAPFAVAGIIAAGYWFTPSTSFANPAVTLARAFTDSFTGIRPMAVPGFMAAQFLGALAATVLFRWMQPPEALPAVVSD